MKEELTTKMHAEFTVSEETDRKLRALSLLQMERDGLNLTDERLEDEGISREQLEEYRKEYSTLLSK
ncbi:hypothetical protein [Dyadobacter sp. LHD-138]|uniref:hypothetical protein n=1 Tax=Dyadobacter sp. LHD-138 TaxID=3071413 RepID=UPI0027E0D283|nr:hypothetical protein [Dyadobacter sp. LHD-138]MDQ6482249.1 hypothetical protein [Dyadobacter sp. LHD-138]